MKWLHRIGSEPGTEEDAGEPDGTAAGPLRRAAPALSVVFDGLSRDGAHAVLDLGPATQAHLRLYGRFARRIRFESILPEPPRGAGFRAALRKLPVDPVQPFDVVLLWNLLDWLRPGQRADLIERLAQITSAEARLYAVVDASGRSTVRPVRFTPLGLDRVSHEAVGRPVPAGPPLLPAEVQRLLEPFRVRRAFTLRLGQREYAAVKGGPDG